MRNRMLIATVIAAISAIASAPAGAQMMPSQVTTSGTGEARATPDRATIFIGVQSRATTAAAAASDNARRQKAVIDTLKALGLSGEMLSTINYNVQPEMTYPQGGTPRVVAYNVTNTVRAEVRRIDDVGKIIDAALAKGANEISSLQFTSTKADSARRAALAEAVANARGDAEAIAKASGGSLGQLVEVSSAAPTIRPIMYDRAMMSMAKAGAPTPIEPGEMTVQANVTAKWLIVK